MRRSICSSHPPRAAAGSSNTWTFTYIPSENLPKGTSFRFDLMTGGREIDWELPETGPKKISNVIFAKMGGTTIGMKAVEISGRHVPYYEFTLPKELPPGEELKIVMGSRTEGKDAYIKNGNRCQTYSERRRSFLLYVDPKGKSRFGDPEVFRMDVIGSALSKIRVLAPSFVSKNTRFDITARFEDEFGNLTSHAPEETLIELTYKNLRENLNWKIFVPETGFISLPNLYFNEPGIYTIELHNLHNDERYQSPPILCSNETKKQLYWGTLHGESVRVDATENIESCIRHFRDEKCDQFYSCSPFGSEEETPNEVWKLISHHIAEFNEPERFTTFLGFQWEGGAKTEGTRLFLWAKDQKPVLKKKDTRTDSLEKIYEQYSPADLLSIPTFTMGKGHECVFSDYRPDFERVAEIYNSWGCSERTKKAGNPFPIKGPAKKEVQESAEGSLCKALLNNCRFGFVAGGLDDRGIYETFYDSGQEQYPPGITAIVAKEQSRSALFEALRQRSCYATTGPKILVGIQVSGIPMGQEGSTEEKPGLTVNRHIAAYAAGTAPLHSVEIVRNGDILHTYTPDQSYTFQFEYDDLDPLSQAVVKPKTKGESPFVFYYIRVTQEDGNMAWSSPIWVDLVK